MNILAFETASGMCSVAVSQGANLLKTALITESSKQAENLVPMINKVLENASLSLADINYIAVTNGPGSFTGIRIGIATALGLTFGTKIIPVVVSNFELINYRIREQIRNFEFAATIIDAYRDEIYLQIFDKKLSLFVCLY